MRSYFLLFIFAFVPWLLSQDSELKFDQKTLETLEEKTEALANRLLDLSVATRSVDINGIAGFFADRVEGTPFPSRPDASTHQFKWVSRRLWSLTEKGTLMEKKAFLGHWETFLAHFKHIEDTRFKVKVSQIDETGAQAHVYFFLVGRNTENKREWVRGYLDLEAQLVNQLWVIDHFKVTSLASQLAARDVFSEVSGPAGLTEVFPPHGSKQNETSYWQGAAAADVNNDGLIDVFATGLTKNNLYLNNGDGSFRDAAAETWTQLTPRATGPLFLDYDNDGDKDLFLATPDSQVLLENRLVPDGVLEFQDISLKSGIGLRHAIGFSPSAGDVDGNGFVDIYVPSYNRYGLVMPNSWYKATNGTPNLLYLNKGNGVFEEAAARLGVADERWSYASALADLDRDGDLDLYIANDYGENALYINENGSFKDQAAARGAIDPGNGMGVSFGDYDNDGDLDLHVTNMSSTAGKRILGRLLKEPKQSEVLVKLASGNSLYENDGKGHFQLVPAKDASFTAGWAWGGGFLDVDNDGWEDIYTPNGFKSGKSMKDT